MSERNFSEHNKIWGVTKIGANSPRMFPAWLRASLRGLDRCQRNEKCCISLKPRRSVAFQAANNSYQVIVSNKIARWETTLRLTTACHAHAPPKRTLLFRRNCLLTISHQQLAPGRLVRFKMEQTPTVVCGNVEQFYDSDQFKLILGETWSLVSCRVLAKPRL